MARPVPIGLGVVKMGHWYRVRGAPQAFQVIAVEWSQSEPPVPDQVLLKPEGGSDEDVMAGPARALLRADCEYVGPPDWGTKKHAVDCDMDEDCRCGVE